MASTIAAGTTVGTAIAISGDTSGALQLQTNGTTTAVTIDTSQNVGIGTASPVAKLNVKTLDAAYAAMIAGTTIGARFSSDSLGLYIDGTDPTGSAAYQPLFTGGSVFGVRISGTEQMRIDSAGLLKFNSGYGSVATAYGCRAWVNFNGTGTVAIRASGNVSSITDNGTGLYTVNFTTAMSDANYEAQFQSLGASGSVRMGYTASVTTSAFAFAAVDGSGTPTDQIYNNVSVFR